MSPCRGKLSPMLSSSTVSMLSNTKITCVHVETPSGRIQQLRMVGDSVNLLIERLVDCPPLPEEEPAQPEEEPQAQRPEAILREHYEQCPWFYDTAEHSVSLRVQGVKQHEFVRRYYEEPALWGQRDAKLRP